MAYISVASIAPAIAASTLLAKHGYSSYEGCHYEGCYTSSQQAIHRAPKQDSVYIKILTAIATGNFYIELDKHHRGLIGALIKLRRDFKGLSFKTTRHPDKSGNVTVFWVLKNFI